jgi:hypothetical protein
MAATSFNGTTATIGGTSVLVNSITVGGGDSATVDVTDSTASRRLQLAGFNEPRTITISGLAESIGFSAGTAYTVVIGSNTPMAATYTGWLCQSLEITGAVDDANTFTVTFLEVSGAS